MEIPCLYKYWHFKLIDHANSVNVISIDKLKDFFRFYRVHERIKDLIIKEMEDFELLSRVNDYDYRIINLPRDVLKVKTKTIKTKNSLFIRLIE